MRQGASTTLLPDYKPLAHGEELLHVLQQEGADLK